MELQGLGLNSFRVPRIKTGIFLGGGLGGHYFKLPHRDIKYDSSQSLRLKTTAMFPASLLASCHTAGTSLPPAQSVPELLSHSSLYVPNSSRQKTESLPRACLCHLPPHPTARSKAHRPQNWPPPCMIDSGITQGM